MTQRETHAPARRRILPTLGTVTRVLRPSLPLPLHLLPRKVIQDPLRNLLPPRRYCVCGVRPLIAVSRQETRRVLSRAPASSSSLQIYALPCPYCSRCWIYYSSHGGPVHSWTTCKVPWILYLYANQPRNRRLFEIPDTVIPRINTVFVHFVSDG